MISSRYLGLAIGLFLGVAGLAVGGYFLYNTLSPASHPPLSPRLENAGSCLILASERALGEYAEAIAVAQELHPDAPRALFDPENPAAALPELRSLSPRFAMIFLMPDELDANVAWAWLKTAVQIDDDPFVDVSTGYITGETPADALALIRRIRDTVNGKTLLPAMFIDNLAANPSADPSMFQKMRGSYFLPSFEERFHVRSISCGIRGFGKERLDSMEGAGVVHFGGHGYPDRIVDTLNGVFVRRLLLSTSVVFNGACYTGVTGRWFDMTGNTVEEQWTPSNVNFCLGLLKNNVVAYLAALHADHGIPVYQEMEYMAYSGAPLGDVMKHSHDALVLAGGGTLPDFPGFAHGVERNWTPSEFMIFGTGTRVLFGDPAMVLAPAFTAPPFTLASTLEHEALIAEFVLENERLRGSFTDTFFADMAYSPQGFNDRALLTVPLPAAWQGAEAEVLTATASGNPLQFRLVGQATERHDGAMLLHVQVDFPSSAYMTSDFRNKGSRVTLRVTQR
jgi:hypothetical protein